MNQPSTERNLFNPDLFSLMPDNAARVLEPGCNNGEFGKAYKAKFPNCEYIGLEFMDEYARLAETHLDSITVGDAEDRKVVEQAVGERPVDCVVYGDVLEHFRDPWASLKMHASFLTKTGCVVACIPNIQHWTVLLNLFQGKWEYKDSGLLDRTHLRFFTGQSVLELFQQAGLKVIQMKGRRPSNDQFEQFFRIVEPVLPALGVQAQSFVEAAGTIQFVVRAEKQI